MLSIKHCHQSTFAETPLTTRHMLVYIYIYIYIYVCALHKQVLQLCKFAVCAKWHIALLPRSTLFSGFLRSVALLPQAFCSQSNGFRRSRRAPSPILLCTGAMRSGQLFSIRIVCRFTLRALHLHYCWITLCWCAKYPSKDNLLLPLLARKWDNRQNDGKTMGKVAVRQS